MPEPGTDAREPAWRLLHAVTLLKLHQARTRAHMAYHDPKGPREPRQAKPQAHSPGHTPEVCAQGLL